MWDIGYAILYIEREIRGMGRGIRDMEYGTIICFAITSSRIFPVLSSLYFGRNDELSLDKFR